MVISVYNRGCSSSCKFHKDISENLKTSISDVMIGGNEQSLSLKWLFPLRTRLFRNYIVGQP